MGRNRQKEFERYAMLLFDHCALVGSRVALGKPERTSGHQPYRWAGDR